MLLYASTSFLSAFLLFVVQPVIAKQILPWFGGAAAVWATCLVFFQSVLLLGYAYADWTARRLSPRGQAWLHVILLAVSLAALPIVAADRWKPGPDSEPALLILGLLAATIGLPYLLLSATSPLVQAWFWRRYRHAAPYRLFALSNLASLLGLLCYPVLVEPTLALSTQSAAWSIGYAAFAVLCGATALATPRDAAPAPAAAEAGTARAASPAARERLLWVALSAMGSCLLLAVTNHLTQNVASVPFLWVAPLSLYLVTFILAFDHPRWYRREVFLPATAILLPAMAWYGDSLDLWTTAPLHAVGLLACCMFCHGELARLAPAPGHLTTFYLMLALGGAVGAFLVGIAAPNLLSGPFELGIALVACALLLVLRSGALGWWVVSASAVVLAGTAILVAVNVRSYFEDTRVTTRSFYGVLRTRDFASPTPYRSLYHGAIDHGGQLLEPDRRSEPSSYFGRASGYGRAFASLPASPRRVGVIGLGAGALMAYARKGDVFRFYEIDPKVVRIASTEFTFLRDSPARVEVVVGDGRLALEREASQEFDLLGIDAFSGDAIPMHLLTREAMAIYVRHVKPDGVIVFQATNRFVDIAPVVERLAASFGWNAVLVSDTPEASDREQFRVAGTAQIIVTRNRALLEAEPIASVAEPIPAQPRFPVWTDDFHNLLSVLN
jgi:SAM-dependent methyltransferase